jgi:hypothetical protein
MDPATVEDRLTQLEKRVDELVRQGSTIHQSQTARKDWRRTVGMFKGDPIMRQIIDEALRTREDERRGVNEQNGMEQS